MTHTTTRQRPLDAAVHLRPVDLSDWPTIHEWARRSDVTQYQEWGPNRAIETREYVLAAIGAASELPQVRHVLSVVERDRVVGLIELTVTDPGPRIADLGYAVHPNASGRGIATAAARLAVRFAFDQLGFRMVHATCDTTNAASVRVLEKLGMRLEQTIPHHIWLGSRWRDTHVFSLRAEDAMTHTLR
jgi:[ribosomal protein S5]-alanine N-acetyltransferase